MSRFDELMDNIFLSQKERYNRIFVVSAYSGITDMLLEDKKTIEPGVYASFAKGDGKWEDLLGLVRERMIEINHSFENIGLDTKNADAFISERIDGIKAYLRELSKIRSCGRLIDENYLPACRELLSAIGEAHSAYNSVLILQTNGINARFVDLTGWEDTATFSLNTVIERAFKDIDLESELPIVTGYAKCSEGMVTQFGRGYSEITFGRLAVVTGAREGIIHKEYHLCTGDPQLHGLEKVKVIGDTSFEVANRFADMEMEAVHSEVAKEMETKNIPIRIKNAFDPEHPGTLISKDYISPSTKVDMICGRNDVLAVEVIGDNSRIFGNFRSVWAKLYNKKYKRKYCHLLYL